MIDAATIAYPDCVAAMMNGLVAGGRPVGPGSIFSLGDPDTLQALAENAGFEQVQVAAIDVTFHADSIEAHLAQVSALAGPLAAALKAADDTQLAKVRRTAAQLAADYTSDGVLDLPGGALLLAADGAVFDRYRNHGKPPVTARSLFLNARVRRDVDEGEVIYAEGDEGSHMYGVIDGAVDLRKGTTTVAQLTPGDVFGERALVDHLPRNVTAIATAPTQLAEIDQQLFLFLVHETPTFALEIMAALAARLRDYDNWIGERLMTAGTSE